MRTNKPKSTLKGFQISHFLLLGMQELMVNADKQTEIDSQGISNEHFLLLWMQELMVNADKQTEIDSQGI